MPLTRSKMPTAESSMDAMGHERQVTHDASSVIGSQGSGVSRHSSSSRTRLLLAELKEKQLREKLSLEQRELAEKQQRLLMEARHEVELAKLEEDLEDGVSGCSADSVKLNQMNRVHQYVLETNGSGKSHKPTMGEQIKGFDTHDLRVPKAALPVSRELPKFELMSFDGNPVHYWKFMKQFDIYVGDRTEDEGQRLLYLMNYCKGRAREAIEECVMLPPSSGYRRARTILKNLFGRTHEIARSLMDELIDIGKGERNHPDYLSRLAIKMENCDIALTQMDYTADLNSLSTLERVVRILPGFLRHEWAKRVDKVTFSSREPTFRELAEFVSESARIQCSRFGQLATGPRDDKNRMRPSASETKRTGLNFALQRESSEPLRALPRCVKCSGSHQVSDCHHYLALPVAERWSFAREKGLCFVCLKGSHRAGECKTRIVCKNEGCKGRHHPTLHNSQPSIPATDSSGNKKIVASAVGPNEVTLGLVPVNIKVGNEQVCGYAFLDSGSDTTLIRKDVSRALGLDIRASPVSISTMSGTAYARERSGEFSLHSIDGKESILVDRAVVVEQLPIKRPGFSMETEKCKWAHLSEVHFDSVENGEVLVLIGCDVPEAHWVLDQRLGGRKMPFAIRTLLGWVAFGPIGFSAYRRSVHCVVEGQFSPSELWQRIYDTEFFDAQSIDKAVSIEDAATVEFVERGTTFSDGHFTVPLPWKKGSDTKDGNHGAALARLKNLKRRLISDKVLMESYSKTMENMITKGYAEPVPEAHLATTYRPRWFLPHHAVINPRKPEKVRIVLDCAAKYEGRCLNDMLHQGPDTTANLVGILLRFRREPIAVCADIEEMFMQVKVPESDRGALRFLWWPSGDLCDEPKEYQMTSHPFGATSSPYCANYALCRTARDFGLKFDTKVTEAVYRNFYVDDCLVSLRSIEEAQGFVKQVTEMLMLGGFRLRKWVSNSKEVMTVVPQADLQLRTVDMPVPEGLTHRTLGVGWVTDEDVFSFRFQSTSKPLTRRGVLSVVSSFFDPLGLVAPLCLPAKVLLQQLCRANLGWDQPLNEESVASWETWVSFMHRLGDIQIPRTIQRVDRGVHNRTEMHVYCDASESGYGAVVYAWQFPREGPPYNVLLFSKSRVAPMKTITIPRLELSAAVLGVQIAHTVQSSLPGLFDEIRYWTDSMIVLYYVNDTSTRFTTFVANRLSMIHQYSSSSQWSHVNSEDNLADLASRGIKKESELRTWLNGPRSPQKPGHPALRATIEPEGVELKRSPLHVCAGGSQTETNPLLLHYSEWSTLVRAVAWLVRFTVYMKIMFSKHKGDTLRLGHFTVSELDDARKKIILLVQKEAYSDLIKKLERTGESGKLDNSPLQKLCPLLQEGVLCVGGRMNYANYPQRFKHPIILPNHHHVTEVIIRYHHALEGHSSTSQVLAAVRRNYWIVKGNSAIRRVIGRCIMCRKLNASAGQQLMAPLPLSRVQKGWFCFSSVGVDYFGPLTTRRGRGLAKRYGCVFTCLQTRAIHLELATSLSSDSFILALTRFMGRRGTPTEIYSDNGSNFVGSLSELRDHIKRWDGRKIGDRLVSQGIQWHFNPPASSHRGGVWERMIRSVRRLLLALSREQVLSDEALATLFIEVERVLNNRPLVPLLSDDIDKLALTPNSLLLLRDCDSLPIASLSNNYSQRWRQVNHLANTFWKRWLNEYVPTLQTRQRWLSKYRNFKKGDVVLVVIESVTRGDWPLGIIESCEPDPDGLVRTVNVRTRNGVLRRDIRKVCLLEGAD